jgi:hypothetical protein
MRSLPAQGLVSFGMNRVISWPLHVGQNAYKAKVTLFDQTTYDADVVGYEPTKDLAVLQIKTNGPLNLFL